MSTLLDTVQSWDDEVKAAVLERLLEFPLSQKVFEMWAARTITCPDEFCILDSMRQRILLAKRPESDPFYAGMWHVTGGVMLPGQLPGDVWERLRTSPKYGLAELDLSEPKLIGVIDTLHAAQSEGGSPRGAERNKIHVVKCRNLRLPEVPGCKWFPLSELPLTGTEALIGHHQRYIREILTPWLLSSNWLEWRRFGRQ